MRNFAMTVLLAGGLIASLSFASAPDDAPAISQAGRAVRLSWR